MQVGRLPGGQVAPALHAAPRAFAPSRGGEVRGADRARAFGEARLEPAPERIGLRAAADPAQRDQHAAEIVVARRRQSRPEADELRRLVAERIAGEPAVDRLERRLRMHAERVVHAEDHAAQALVRHVAIEAGAQRFQVAAAPCRAAAAAPRIGRFPWKPPPQLPGRRLECGDQRVQRAAAERGVADAGVPVCRNEDKSCGGTPRTPRLRPPRARRARRARRPQR